MASRKKLILLPSRSMDNNRKEGRNESNLIRMAAKARQFLLSSDKVEIQTAAGTGSQGPVLLDVFHAFSTDVGKAKELIKKGDLRITDLNRIGFVTTKTYNRITGGDRNTNIWVSSGAHDTVIGADPEFLLFNDSGSVVHADRIMSKTGIIGCDGAMAEVRPKPSTNPEGLVKNIKSAFSNKSLTSAIDSYEWRAGCYFKNSSRDYPMGGHIHVGNPAEVANIPMTKREMFFNVLNKIMDEFIAIPCMKLDGDMGINRRTKCQMSRTGGFGYFGEWRPCDGRLEHRTLSGMWLMHPVVAMCVLGTAKAITDEFFKRWSDHKFEHIYVIPARHKNTGKANMNNDNFSDWRNFPVCKDIGATMSSKELRQILNMSKGSDISKSWLDKWHAKMRRLSTYSKYSKYIDGLREILKISMPELSKWDRKIQNNWLRSKKFLVNI